MHLEIILHTWTKYKSVFVFSKEHYYSSSGQTTTHVVWESDPNLTKQRVLILSFHKQDNFSISQQGKFYFSIETENSKSFNIFDNYIHSAIYLHQSPPTHALKTESR